jgi:hypothetical protein
LLEEEAHAAEIAFALFAYVRGKEDGNGRCDIGVAKGRRNAEQTSESGSVVADAGSVDARAVTSLTRLARGSGREDGIKVSGEKDAGSMGWDFW